MNSIVFVATVSDANTLDNVPGTRRLAARAGATFLGWIGNHVSCVYQADDFGSHHMAALLSQGKDPQTCPHIARDRLADRTEALVKEVRSWVGSLPHASLVVAHADLVRLLGHNEVSPQSLYAVRVQAGMISMIFPLTDEQVCAELMDALEEAGESPAPAR